MDILPMPPSDPAKVIAKAHEVLSRPEYTDFPDAPVRTPPPAHSGLECHMRSMSYCQNEPHCTEAGECVLFLAIPSARNRKASDIGHEAALRAIREVTGVRQDRPWTALSLIDQIARKALA
ncbi:MAG TPA: hypothetical protein VNU68_34970 [Verrucomicrobiae bacterium]|nr:hypothetical protein [Verrucomicrobiae bacterium]